VQDGRAYWSHVGDSRLYLLRKGEVLVRTRDHTLVQKLVDEGRMQADDMSSHPERNRLLQCLGGVVTPRIQPTAHALLDKDDVLLLCSDGLWGPLTERQILDGFAGAPLAEAVPRLATLAETQGGAGADNITALALAWGEEMAAGREGPRTVPNAEGSTEAQDFGATDPDFLRMTDADIERAIEQIKLALKRNVPPR
jgi:PPM family protein phosphatase